MKTDMKPRGALRLTPCSYGLSKIQFRGPLRSTDGRYIVFLGGADTFAKYIQQPFPQLVETAIGEICVNLGCAGAGPDVFLHDAAIHSLCHDALATVIHVPSAVNLSNRYYRVHPRRNDRFVAPTALLTSLYPEVDFAEIAFTGHLMSLLRKTDDRRFGIVRSHLEKTWEQRMRQLIAKACGPVMLLWFASRHPEDDLFQDDGPMPDPALVTRKMLEALRDDVADVIEVICPSGNTTGMAFAPLEALAARQTLGEDAHIAAAKALRTPLLHAL